LKSDDFIIWYRLTDCWGHQPTYSFPKYFYKFLALPFNSRRFTCCDVDNMGGTWRGFDWSLCCPLEITQTAGKRIHAYSFVSQAGTFISMLFMILESHIGHIQISFTRTGISGGHTGQLNLCSSQCWRIWTCRLHALLLLQASDSKCISHRIKLRES